VKAETSYVVSYELSTSFKKYIKVCFFKNFQLIYQNILKKEGNDVIKIKREELGG